MNKYASLLLVALITLSFSLVGCGDDEDNSKDYRIDFSEKNVLGTWNVSEIDSSVYDSLSKRMRVYATVTPKDTYIAFHDGNFTLTQGTSADRVLQQGTYKVGRYYIRFNYNNTIDSFAVVNQDMEKGHKLVLYKRLGRVKNAPEVRVTLTK